MFSARSPFGISYFGKMGGRILIVIIVLELNRHVVRARRILFKSSRLGAPEAWWLLGRGRSRVSRQGGIW